MLKCDSSSLEKLLLGVIWKNGESKKEKKYSFFLGAGASIQSGVKSATQCIWDWKKSIYDSHQTSIINADIANDRIKNIVQAWIDKQGIYPQTAQSCGRIGKGNCRFEGYPCQ